MGVGEVTPLHVILGLDPRILFPFAFFQLPNALIRSNEKAPRVKPEGDGWGGVREPAEGLAVVQ